MSQMQKLKGLFAASLKLKPLNNNPYHSIIMKVLHICNGFAGSKVHVNLAKALDSFGINQILYCPVRERSLIGKNQFLGNYIEFVYSYCIKSWYKYVFHYKAYKLYQDLKRNVDLNSINIIHAHTLFSDGVLAYKAKKEFSIPYIVAVRNTDVNGFVHLMKHCHSIGREILLNAEKVFFISQALKNTFEQSSFVKPILNKVKDKFILSPNGIDDYWHDHISHDAHKGHNVLYIGDFSSNKNVVRLAKAVLKLRKEESFGDARLIIIGGAKDCKDKSKTQATINANTMSIKALGKIYDKDKLAEVMRYCSVFAMPSIHETFGLVYLEALSQNLPVLYTKGQGIDGLFDNTVGVGVNPKSVDDISTGLRELLLHHDKYGNQHVNFALFDWKIIAQNYANYYDEILIQQTSTLSHHL